MYDTILVVNNMKVLIATKNPTKIEGAKRAFSKFYNNVEVIGVPANSDVSEEPVNDELLQGAKNRVENLKSIVRDTDVDFFIAIESGITNQLGDWQIINMAVVEDKTGKQSVGSSAGFPVPDELVDEIIEEDLGTVMDKIFNEDELRSKAGGVSLLTKGVISRYDLTEQAFIMALTRFVNGGVWE